nr:group II intron maturase-specific domain-containing protein [Paenibacillus caui]
MVKKTLNPYLRGWANYFGYGRGGTFFKEMDKWIRRRLKLG